MSSTDLHLLLAVHVAHAHGQEAEHLRALHLVLDHGAELGGDRRVGERLLQVRLVAEQEVEREHARLRRQRRRVGGRRDDEVDVAGAQLLQHLRLLAELRAGELVDAHLAARELLELGVEDVGGDAVGGRRRLVVREAELARRLRRSERSGEPARPNDQAAQEAQSGANCSWSSPPFGAAADVPARSTQRNCRMPGVVRTTGARRGRAWSFRGTPLADPSLVYRRVHQSRSAAGGITQPQGNAMTDRPDSSRRRALAQLSAGSLATLAPWACAAQAKPLTVGVIYVGPRDDFGYNQAQAAGRRRDEEAARHQGRRGGERARDHGGAEDDDRHDPAGRRQGRCSRPRSATSIRTCWWSRPSSPTSASRTAAASGPRRTRRTPAATSATSRSAST